MNPLEVIYEDDDIVAINKESGVLSIPDRYDPTVPNLYDTLNKIHKNIFVVHRLDKNTSGVILFAKHEDAHRDLNQQFQERKIEKIYLAVVKGHPLQDKGKIETGIKKLSNGRSIIHDKGLKSVTLYETLERFKSHTFLRLQLLTGRTHQARVHLEYLGCPLVVDPMYGGSEGFYLSSVKKNYRLSKHKEERPLVDRTPLHAHQLTFRHPGNQESITLEAELPKDMNALLNQLQKWSSIER